MDVPLGSRQGVVQELLLLWLGLYVSTSTTRGSQDATEFVREPLSDNTLV
jgi:hypothetical protein